MVNTIIHKKSAVADKSPLLTDLEYGEIAINFRDKNIYFKSSDGTNDALTKVKPTNSIMSESNKVMTDITNDDNQTIIGSDNSSLTNNNSTILSSKATKITDAFCVAGGYSSTSSTPATSNTKWKIKSTTGDIELAGALTTSASFADFAEYFANKTGEEIPLGTLVTLDGDSVRPAKEGEHAFGVVSGTAGIIMNDSPLTWQGRFLRGHFGELLTKEVEYIKYQLDNKEIIETYDYSKTYPENYTIFKQEEYIENPNFNEYETQLPRSKRPKEWTPVGLLGQVYVRLTQFVESGDYIKTSTTAGKGGKAQVKTNIKCMKITKAYDSELGYAVGLCLIK